MRRKRTVKDYSKLIAAEEGLAEWRVRLILMFGWMNILQMFKKGQEIKVLGFGRIYFEKTAKHEKHEIGTTEQRAIEIVDSIIPRQAAWLDDE